MSPVKINIIFSICPIFIIFFILFAFCGSCINLRWMFTSLIQFLFSNIYTENHKFFKFLMKTYQMTWQYLAWGKKKKTNWKLSALHSFVIQKILNVKLNHRLRGYLQIYIYLRTCILSIWINSYNSIRQI